MNKPLNTKLIVLVVGSLTLANVAHCVGAEPVQSPEAKQIEAFTKKFFASQPDYQNGNLVTQSQVAGLLKAMLKHEWVVNPKDKEQLLKRVLADDAFLVKQLNTTQRGRTFLNKIRNYPGGIDRLDKIAQMPKGQRDVHAMIYKIPDGDRWIQGMTMTEHGRRMGESISRWQHDNFNEKTGRIYTLDQLIPELVKVVHLPQLLEVGQPVR